MPRELERPGGAGRETIPVDMQGALKEKDANTAPQRLITLEIEADGADGSGYEPVWKDFDQALLQS